MPHKRRIKSDSLDYIFERRNAAKEMCAHVKEVRQKKAEAFKKEVEEFKDVEFEGPRPESFRLSCNGITKTYSDLTDFDAYDFI